MSALTPANQVPWAVNSPFRMRPGLQRLGASGHAHSEALAAPPKLFVRDALACAYARRKQEALEAHRVRCQIGAADPAVLKAIAGVFEKQTGIALPPEADALAQGLQEDFVILHDEPEGEAGARETLRTRFLSVCFPSNWSPAEKYGLDFTAIHAPVADNARLQAGGQAIVDLAFRQATMLRHVWLLTSSGDLPQHPETRRTRWEDAVAQADAPGASGRLIDQVFYRVERQTTLPLPALRRGVFFIRVMVCPLTEALGVEPGRAAQLADALGSMSEAVVAYRGMGAVRERLCAELGVIGS